MLRGEARVREPAVVLQQLDERLVGVVEVDARSVRRGFLAGTARTTGYAASSAHSSAKAST